MNITSYLTFNGNCREAMSFYKSCLGGQLHFQTIGDSPMTKDIPLPMKKAILQATLIKDNIKIMASDLVGEKGLKRGNAISLLLHCTSEKEIKDRYRRLSDGGQCTHPLTTTFWGDLMGDLVDKYGNQWLLYFERSSVTLPSNK